MIGWLGFAILISLGSIHLDFYTYHGESHNQMLFIIDYAAAGIVAIVNIWRPLNRRLQRWLRDE